jgi:thiol-disulfide isomerase/thioredoxin
MHVRAIVSLVLGAALLLAGCGTAMQESASTPGAAEASHLAFSGETLDGTSFDGAQLAGKPAVLWFWAPWCPTCRAQAAGVSRLDEQYAGRVNVVGVGGLGDVADIREYAGQVDGPTQLIDPDGAVWRHFGVTAQSTYVVLDAEGAVVAEGYLDDHALAEQVAELAELAG